MTFSPFGRIEIEPLYKELYIPDVGDTFIPSGKKVRRACANFVGRNAHSQRMRIANL